MNMRQPGGTRPTITGDLENVACVEGTDARQLVADRDTASLILSSLTPPRPTLTSYKTKPVTKIKRHSKVTG